MRRPGDQAVEHLFIFHNGLNENDNLRLYYRLADWIFSEYAANRGDGTAACMVVPFAGHLMHAPFHGPFSQTPLSRYLGDSGELFRQFLRYMVQMRWLLSCVGSLDEPSWRVGWNMIEAATPEQLSIELCTEWAQLASASVGLLRRLERQETEAELREGRISPKEAARRRKRSRRDLIGAPVTQPDIYDGVTMLRSVLNGTSSLRRPRLKTHVVGYSLGGFLAQSVFFAWPQQIASCTTICSGGAISAISPTAFAHSEEWQAVLHSLRAELEDSMLHRRLLRDSGKHTVAGMSTPQFGYFKRIFDQVFLQEDKGSYRQRLSEYSARMLFVSGGEDPIVKTENVLDASPSEGINMLSIANLTHFLGQAPGGHRQEEVAQREFWLPEVGRLIARAAMRAEELDDEETAAARQELEVPDDPGRSPPPTRPRQPALSSSEFDDALDWVLDAVAESSGWLVVSRNTLPAALLDEKRFTEWGAALHHHDARIQRYARALRRRAAALDARSRRVTLLLPNKLEQWFVNASALFDPQSDTPRGRIMIREDRRDLWDIFDGRWSTCIRELYPGPLGKPLDGSPDGEDLIPALTAWQNVDTAHLTITHLPDLWIGLSGGRGAAPGAKAPRRALFEQEFVTWVAHLVRDLEPGGNKLRKDLPEDSATAELQEQIDDGRVRIVQVSDAEFNPRYRGRVERNADRAVRLLAQCAAGMLRSRPRREQSRDAS